MEYLPYTYLIGWTNLNKWYYGAEYGMKKIPCANPENLWKTYFTSSKVVEFFRKNHGEPDVIQVRKIFNIGSTEQRMENSITWEKRVLFYINIVQDKWLNGRIGGIVCPSANSKICMMRYGVENAFQSPEIKEKIKNKNLSRYGVEHPSYSKELLEKKKQNNLKKYGVECNLSLPHVREKAKRLCQSEEAKLKRQQTVLSVYGVKYLSQNQEIKSRVLKNRSQKSNRNIVKLIREYKRVFGIKLSEGWYQLSDDKLNEILKKLQVEHGIFSLDELEKIQITKKYSSSIKLLQEREVVQKIKKYKEKYKKKLKLGKNWDRKSNDKLEVILIDLEKAYGKL
jgi:hypothetical protein